MQNLDNSTSKKNSKDVFPLDLTLLIVPLAGLAGLFSAIRGRARKCYPATCIMVAGIAVAGCLAYYAVMGFSYEQEIAAQASPNGPPISTAKTMWFWLSIAGGIAPAVAAYRLRNNVAQSAPPVSEPVA